MLVRWICLTGAHRKSFMTIQCAFSTAQSILLSLKNEEGHSSNFCFYMKDIANIRNIRNDEPIIIIHSFNRLLLKV